MSRSPSPLAGITRFVFDAGVYLSRERNDLLLVYFYTCRDDRKLALLVKQFTLIDEGEAKACAEAVGQMTAVGSSSRTMKSLGVSNDDAAVDEPILLILKPVI